MARARIGWRAPHGQTAPTIARALAIGGDTVRLWLTRCNAAGRDGLADRPRSGRPAQPTDAAYRNLIAPWWTIVRARMEGTTV